MLNINLTKACAGIATAGILLSSRGFIESKVVPVEKPMNGVVISEKVENIDWESLSNTKDFVLINAGNGIIDDKSFEDNYSKARKAKLDVGVVINNELSTYYRNTPSDITLYAERRYSHVKISQLMDKVIKYPVYLRIDYGDTPIEVALPKEHANDLFKRYEMIMTHNKFKPGVYASEEVVNYLRENIENFDERFESIISNSKEDNSVVSTELLSTESSKDQFDENTPIKATELPNEIEYVYTMKNYNDRSKAIIPGILLSLDLLGCLGIQRVISKEKKKISQ